jgi:hypothetical protein
LFAVKYIYAPEVACRKRKAYYACQLLLGAISDRKGLSTRGLQALRTPIASLAAHRAAAYDDWGRIIEA